MYTEYNPKSARGNGIWNLNLIRDIICKKEDNDSDRKFYAVLDYQNEVTKQFASDTVPLTSLVDKVAGFQYKREDGHDTRIGDNVSFDRKHHILNISKADVDGYSKIMLKHWGYDKITYDEKVRAELDGILKPRGMDRRIGYVGSHLISGAQGNSDVDYYILPSYEVMRYFFITNTKLSRILLENLARYPLRAIDGICEKISNDILVNASGERVASLFVKQGFKKDIPLLARVMYIAHARKCLGFLQNSIYKSGIPDAEYEFRHLLTRLPQSEPFQMAVCGKEFIWRKKKYLFICQIYDTKEIFPYDKIIHAPLGKDSRSFVGDVAGVNPNGGHQGIKSIPDAVTGLSHTEAGDTDSVGEILLTVRTGFRFKDKPKITLKKLPKTEQELRNEGFGTAEIEKIKATTNIDKLDPDSDHGRLVAVTDPMSERNPRRECFLAALAAQKEYSVEYFKASAAAFVSDETFTVTQSVNHYNILCCRLAKNGCSIYILRCDSSQDDSCRYAIFHSENFGPVAPALLRRLHDDVWKFSGIYPSPAEINLSGFISYYQRHNQGVRNEDELTAKIFGELDSRYKDYVKNAGNL